jgi:cytochrome c-type biogenesis protein CcmH/NrfG
MMRREQGLLGVILVAAAGLYVWLGQPGLPDQPFADRAADIAARDVNDLTPDEFLTRLQGIAQERPDLPDPHFYIAMLLRDQGRGDDAIRAFQAALRRDERHVGSLIGLADTLVLQEGGTFGPLAERLYAQAWQIDAGQARAGFLAGLAAWQDSRPDEAEQRWEAVIAALPPDDPQRAQVLDLMDTTRQAADGGQDAQP